MKSQTRNRLEHGASLFISVLLNSALLLAMLHFITMEPSDETETSRVMVIEPEETVEVEEIPEEDLVEDPVEVDEFVDTEFDTFDTEIDTDFDVETEVVDTATEAADVNELADLLSDIASPVEMVNLMPGRTEAMRQEALNRYAGGMGGETEAAVDRALGWLQSRQLPDGSWHQRGNTSGNGNAGTTGLALLTYLSNGQTPASAQYGETVAKAIRFLVESQNEEGMFRPGREVYAHAMATYALAEAYTMTDNLLLREPVEKGARVMLEGMMENGGFPGADSGYQYGRTGPVDASVSGWNIQALKAVQIAAQVHDMEIPGLDAGMQRAMDGMMLNAERTDSGHVTMGYKGPGRHRIVTSAGGLALHLTGRGGDREARQVINYLSQFNPEWGSEDAPGGGGAINFWYYAVQAIFHHAPDGSLFRRFNRGMATALVENQQEDGRWDCFTGNQGPLYETTLAALSLMVYYRYLPTTQADRIQQQPREREDVIDDGVIQITL